MMWIWIVGAYLCGSVSFAIVVSAGLGLQDPRLHGSKNAGATNVLRLGSRWAALLIMLLDGLKGFLFITVMMVWLPAGVAYAAVALVIGHILPIFHRFCGGKGVAASLGVICALDAQLGCAVIGIWLAAFACTRVSSVAALCSVCCSAPLLFYHYHPHQPTLYTVLCLAAIVTGAHYHNWVRLLQRRENKIG